MTPFTPRDSSFSDSPTLEESLKILAPKQKKLTTVEAQRIMTVLNSTHQRLEGAFALSYLAENVDRYSVSLGADVVAMVKDYERYSDQYKKLYKVLESKGIDPVIEPSASLSSSRPTSTGGLDPTDTDGTESQYRQVQSKLRQTTKTLLRALSQCPAMEAIVEEARKTMSAPAVLLLEDVKSLGGVAHEKLLVTHAEEVDRKNHLEMIEEAQKEAEIEIRQLELDLIEAKQSRDREVHACASPTMLKNASFTGREKRADKEGRHSRNAQCGQSSKRSPTEIDGRGREANGTGQRSPRQECKPGRQRDCGSQESTTRDKTGQQRERTTAQKGKGLRATLYHAKSLCRKPSRERPKWTIGYKSTTTNWESYR